MAHRADLPRASAMNMPTCGGRIDADFPRQLSRTLGMGQQACMD
ncbi:hypothetical protein [Corynebacterium cystitidis]|nr:hypothetical protein [Corynebacterium cystitidis]